MLFLQMKDLGFNKMVVDIKKINIYRKNKKASVFLPEETIKVVLAVICIGLLIFLGYKLYTLFLKKSAIEIARENLDQLVNKINLLKDGQSTKFTLSGPNDWFLMLFSKGDAMPSSCKDAKSCLCICEIQNYGGCDRNGLCKTLDIDGEMSYSCMQASSFDLTNQYKCLKITIKDIPLKKLNFLFIGPTENFEMANKLRQVLLAIDPATNKSVEQLLGEYVVNKNGKDLINGLMTSYVKTNISEISSWYLTIKLNENIIGIFGYYPTGAGDMPEIPSFRHNYDEVKEYAENKYNFKWEFNLKQETE